MTVTRFFLAAFFILLLAAVALWLLVQSRERAQIRAARVALEAARGADPERFDPAMIADLPEVAQRYLTRAIQPGTPLHRVVQLEMRGTFILNGSEMPMTARQILAPPTLGFVWQADIGSGLMRFSGSDGYLRTESGEESWTKFWLHGLIPLARAGGTPDHARAAATRVQLESVWAPATLLPQFGAGWVQTGPDSAEIRFADAPSEQPMHLVLDSAGNPTEVWALRWSDANPEGVYRLQPFGGRMLELERHQGFLIPTHVEMGNMWGTDDYAPFFFSTITQAEY